MKKQSMPTSFSGFTWALAIFCLPILLCPMALLLSTSLMKNTHLSEFQFVVFSIFLWIYPFILALIARLLYRLNQKNHRLAVKLLIASFIGFYLITVYVCGVGFGGK